MKKTKIATKEKKNTPSETKVRTKDCNGCHEPESYSNKAAEVKNAKYNIIDRVREGNENTWIVTFEKWSDCYCTKKTTTVTIYVDNDRLPATKHLVKLGY